MACFPRLSLLAIFLVLFCFLGLPSVVFHPESWGFSHLIMMPLLLLLCSKSSDTCRRESVWGRRSLPHLLGTRAPLVGETHPPLRDLGPEAFLLLLPLWACVEAGTLRSGAGKKDRDFCTLPECWQFHLALLEPELESYSLSLLCTWVPAPGFWAALRSTWGILVGKKGNFTTASVMLQILVCLQLFSFQRFQIAASCILPRV